MLGGDLMTIDLGLARAIDAEEFGEPGQRTFRLRVIGAASHTASLWLEKEQVQALSLALTQMLAQLGEDEQAAASLNDFPELPEHDFHVGRMAIGFDPADQTIVLQTYGLGTDDEDDEPTLRVRLSQGLSAALNARLREIITHGRPVCGLCGASIDAAGHTCIRANGHFKQVIPDPDSGEEEE